MEDSASNSTLNDQLEVGQPDSKGSMLSKLIEDDSAAIQFEDLENYPNNPVTKFLELSRDKIIKLYSTNKLVKYFIVFILFLLYNAYLVTAVAYHIRNETNFAWCEGIGFLIVCTVLTYIGITYYFVVKEYFGKWLEDNVLKPLKRTMQPIWSLWYVQTGLGLLVFAGFVTFVLLDTRKNRKRLISTLGLFILILIGVVLSKHPGRIRWRHVFWGLGLQFIFGLLILRWNTGRDILKCISDKVCCL